MRLSRGLASLFCSPSCIRMQTGLQCVNGALEIDHARTVGGSPSASLRAFAVEAHRDRFSCGSALRRVRSHSSRGVRHVIGASVLRSENGGHGAKSAFGYPRTQFTLNGATSIPAVSYT